MDLSRLYQPLTAMPFGRGDGYDEAPPCPALRPWVRCYWGTFSKHAASGSPTLVIPDTCFDLIFTHYPASGQVRARFCPMLNAPYHAEPRDTDDCSVFAIRFYHWSAASFAQDDLCGTLNGSFDASEHFPLLTVAISQMLQETPDPQERMRRADSILQQLARPDGCDSTFMNALYALLDRQGRLRVSQLAQSVYTSTRQLERLFNRAIGISPKALASQVRYQLVWHDAVASPRFHVLDAVERYGYTDQSHLLHEFHAFHSMPLSQALAYARQHVAFLQDAKSSI